VKDHLARGDFARLAYRLGRVQATGVLRIDPSRSRPEVLILRRGHLITSEHDVTGRLAHARLARLAGLDGVGCTFDGGTAAYPPGATGRQVSPAAWARPHLEGQVDATRAERLVAELAGARLVLRPEHAPEPIDETDRRMLTAMAQPRRLDQIWTLARTPRFRLLGFLHFLRAVGALSLAGVAAERPVVDPRAAAMRLLGIAGGDASREVVKRAYRRLARALHPDLQPGITETRRRELEAKLVEVNAAYQQLV
jgi:hypothetical protein